MKTRKKMVDALVKWDVNHILHHCTDTEFLETVLRGGEGWVQYSALTDAQVKAEYSERVACYPEELK